ncbi:MAG: universal stress protein [Candidatus Rokuibacteriota bacterium]
MMDRAVGDRCQSGEIPLRVLFAVHGHESAEWTTRACQLVSGWKGARVRVLALVDAPRPPFTSLIAPARRLYAAARSAWRQEEEQRVMGVVDRVSQALSRQLEVVRDESTTGGLAGTIVEHAMDWPADVIVMAAPVRGAQWWVWPGPVQERVLRQVDCAVLAIPSAAAPHGIGRRLGAPRAIASGLGSAVADRTV